MPRVNYIVECREFQRFAIRNRLTANEFMLWHGLLELFNREAKGAWWPDDYLTLANSVVLAQTSFGAGDSACDILFRARKGLVKHGLILYRKGKRNALMPQYKLCYFSVEQDNKTNDIKKETAPAGLDMPEDLVEGAGRDEGKNEISERGKARVKPLKNPINRNIDDKPRPNHTPLPPQGDGKVGPPGLLEILKDKPDELKFDNAWQVSAKARGAVAQRLLNSYEGEVDTKDAWDRLCEVMKMGLPPDAVLRVMM